MLGGLIYDSKLDCKYLEEIAEDSESIESIFQMRENLETMEQDDARLCTKT